MAALSIQLPFPVFTDADGQPIEDGYVWIGRANQDPRLHPIDVYFDKDLMVPAGQPLRSVGGYIVHNGSPAQLFIDGTDYSTLVQNRKGVDVYSFSSGASVILAATAATAAKLQIARTLTIGNTGKSFDGSTNVSWSLAEIGAVSQPDIGAAPSQVPLNGYLGTMAYQNAEAVTIKPQARATPAMAGEMVFELTSDTSLVVKVKGSDGVVRSATLTLA